MVVAAAGSGIFLLAVLACPISMGLMMLFMGRGMMGGKGGRGGKDERSEPTLGDLKAEHARLADKITRLDRDAPAAYASEEEATEREPIRSGA